MAQKQGKYVTTEEFILSRLGDSTFLYPPTIPAPVVQADGDTPTPSALTSENTEKF
jgi:hypothetical protein